MDEQVLVRNYTPKMARVIAVLAIIGLFFSALFFVIQYSANRSTYSTYQETFEQHQEAGSCGSYYDSNEHCFRCKYVMEHSSALFMTLDDFIIWVPVVALPLLGLIIKLLMTSFSLTVTDKRVYCRNLWIHHVCIPVDSITAVARISLFGIVSVTAPSGHIVVSVLNAKEIYNTVNALLIERQQKRIL